MPRAVSLVVKIDGQTTQEFTKATQEASKEIELFGHTLDVKGAVSLASVAGAAGFAAKKVIDFTKSAAASRDQMAALELVYQNAGAATDGYTDSIKRAVAAGAEHAFTGGQVRVGLENLVVATGDAAEAEKQLAVAMDIARLANVDLDKASKAVALAIQGQDAQLRRLIPGLEKGETATDTLANATLLAAGQADKFAASSEGMGIKASMAWKKIGNSIGKIFLPVLDAVLPAFIPVLDAFGQLINAILPVLLPLVDLLADGITAVLLVIEKIVGWITKLINKLSELSQKIRDIIPDMNLLGDLGNRVFGSNSLTVATESAARGPSQHVSGGTGNIIINISGDPAQIEREVIRALRTFARRQGFEVAHLTRDTA